MKSIKTSLSRQMLSLLLGICLVFQSSYAQMPSTTTPIYLRYEGYLTGNQIPADVDTISTRVTVFDESGAILFTETSTASLVNQRFSLIIGKNEPISQEAFQKAVSMQLQVDTNGDMEYDQEIKETIGQTPKALEALAVKGPVDATNIKVNGVEIISADGKWLGSPILPTYRDQPVISQDGDIRSRDIYSSNIHITDLGSVYIQGANAEESKIINSLGIYLGDVENQNINTQNINTQNLIVSQNIDTQSLTVAQNINVQSLTATQNIQADQVQANAISASAIKVMLPNQMAVPVINESGQWVGAEIKAPSYHQADGTLIINQQGQWVGGDINSGVIQAQELRLDQSLYINGNQIFNQQGQLLVPLDATLDSDGDGFKNWQEVLLGFDALNNNQKPLDSNADQIPDILVGPPGIPGPPGEKGQGLDLIKEGFISSVIVSSIEDFNVPQLEPLSTLDWAVGNLNLNGFNAQSNLRDFNFEVNLNYSNYNNLEVFLKTPSQTLITLHARNTATFKGSYGVKDADFVAAFTPYLLNPASLNGVWSLVVKDGLAEVTATLNSFKFNYQYLNESQATISGDLDLSNHRITSLADPIFDTDAVHKKYIAQKDLDARRSDNAVYRWTKFDTYDEYLGAYSYDNNALLFGGINPSDWRGNSNLARANQINTNLLSSFLNKIGYGGGNAVIDTEVYTETSNLQTKWIVLEFLIENLSNQFITWPLSFYYGCNASRGEIATIAVNGIEAWQSGARDCNAQEKATNVLVQIPANQVSRVLFAIPPSQVNLSNKRKVNFAFTDNSLVLPNGLKYRKDF